MNEMWEELAAYQPYAERRGFGAEWRRMCTERTSKAADAAESAVLEVAAGAASEAALAALAAAGAASEAVEAAEAEFVAWWARLAIADIREAIEMEEKI